MRVVLQRVSRASVTVDGVEVGAVGRGLLLLVGLAPDDDETRLGWMAARVAGLRIFPDAEGKMNLSVVELGLGALVVSQFTLYGDCRKGRRPGFSAAAPPAVAEPLYRRFCERLTDEGVAPVARGVFGAHMDVSLVNDGPVTLVIEAP